MAVLLPDDVLREIFERVRDVRTLFRCATTCTGWRRLFATDLSFLRRCLPKDEVCRSSPFPGFFAPQRYHQSDIYGPCLVPLPRPVFGSTHRFLASFIPNLDDPGLFDHAVPLVSCNGLLLVRLVLYRTGVHLDPRSVVLCVCNLLAGTFEVLPRLEDDCAIDYTDVTGYALLTDADFSSSSNDHQQERSSFKVLVLGTLERTLWYRLRTFSSTGEPRWNMCSGSLKDNDIHTFFKERNAVVCHGLAHWLFWDRSVTVFYTFDVNTETGDVSSTDLKLPTQLGSRTFYSRYDEPYLTLDIVGRLTLFWLQRDSISLEIWTRHNNGTWTNTRMLEITHPYQHLNKTSDLVYTCLGEKNGTLVIKDNRHHVYVVDVKTRVIMEVKHWSRKSILSRKRTVLLEMDWPALFTSRLGVGM